MSHTHTIPHFISIDSNGKCSYCGSETIVSCIKESVESECRACNLGIFGGCECTRYTIDVNVYICARCNTCVCGKSGVFINMLQLETGETPIEYYKTCNDCFHSIQEDFIKRKVIWDEMRKLKREKSDKETWTKSWNSSSPACKLEMYGVIKLKCLARRKGVIRYSYMSKSELICTLTPLVNNLDFPIML